MYKKAWCTCRVVVLLIKPSAFLTFSLPSPSQFRKVPIKRRRRRLRKRHLKSEFALVQTLLRLFHLVLFRQMLANFLKLKQQRSIAQVPKELRFATLSRVLSRVADSLTLKACSQACAINNYCTGHETF